MPAKSRTEPTESPAADKSRRSAAAKTSKRDREAVTGPTSKPELASAKKGKLEPAPARTAKPEPAAASKSKPVPATAPRRPEAGTAPSGRRATKPAEVIRVQDPYASVRRRGLEAWYERSHEMPPDAIRRSEALARELCRDLAPQGLGSLAEAWAAETEEFGLTPFVMLGLPMELAEQFRAAGADDLARQAQEFLLLAAQMRADRFEERWTAALEQQLETARSAHRLVVHDHVDPSWVTAVAVPTLVAISLPEALTEARAAALPLFEARGQTVEIAAPKNLPAVRAERNRLRRALLDLLVKASEYAADAEHFEITVARKGGDRLAVAIRGTQSGLRNSLKKAGCPTGKALLQSVGGTLTLEGVRGEGVALVFTLGIATRK